MMRSIVSLATLAALIVVGSKVGAQTVPVASRDLIWAPSVTEAFAQSKTEKKPVLWVIMKDKEIACTRMQQTVYGSPAVLAKLKEVVLLPVHPGMHEKVILRKGGEEKDSCPIFRGVTCADHQANERELRARYYDVNIVVAPQHILTDAEGKIVYRKEYELTTTGLLEWLDHGLKLFKGEPVAAAPVDDKKPEPDKPAAKEGDDSPSELSPDKKRNVNRLLTAPDEDRIQAAKDLAGSADKGATKALVDVLAGPEPKPEALKGRVIRALGSKENSHVAGEFVRLFDLKSTFLRNGAVVTIEEMSSPVAAPALLELWKKEKDPEIRKDILRALGPAGAGDAPAREHLLKELKAQDEHFRVASAIALGSHLAGNDDVRVALKERWKKESGNETIKLAILFAYWQSKDASLVADLDGFTAEEKNGEIKNAAEAIRTALGGPRDDEPTAGGNGRGGGGRGGRGGPQMQLFRAFAKLFARDKIERNVVKEMRERFGNRGQGGPGGNGG